MNTTIEVPGRQKFQKEIDGLETDLFVLKN